MAHGFRFYEKKRGNRRTGSRRLGSAGEALFFAVFLLLGCAGVAAVVVTLLIPEWRANNEFVKQTCSVVGARVANKQGEDGTVFRPEIQIEFQVDGDTYKIWTYDVHTLRDNGYSSDWEATEEKARGFAVGRSYYCWYNPANPNEAVLVRGSNWWVWLTLSIPVSFVLVGGIGLTYTTFGWGKSAERKAVSAKTAVELDLSNGDRTQADFPCIPAGKDITDSPGTKLAFRLPIGTSPGWVLFGWAAACLAYNGVVSIFVYGAVAGHVGGVPDWFLTIFILPFAAIGIWLIVLFARQLMINTGVGPTMVEISDQPLYPGERYRLSLTQTGRLKIGSLRVSLVCDEEATYRHGTDTRTESQRVYQQVVLEQNRLDLKRGRSFEANCDIELPKGAMHSFKSEHNEVSWKVVVKGQVASWPDYERCFPVIVYPNKNGKQDRGRSGYA